MKKILSLVLTLAMLCTMCVFTSVSAAEQWNGEAATTFSEGDGTAATPYKIGTAAELKLFANIVNGDGGQTRDLTICGTLTADITLNVGDVSGCNGVKADGWFDWTPICPSYVNPYSGTFDGAGHFVSGLYYNSDSSNSSAGFFGCITGNILNLGIVNSYICARSINTGSVCGYNMSGAIVGCYNTGTVISNYAEATCGGMCGYNDGTITGCYNTGTISGGTTNDIDVGGICGWNHGEIKGCFNTGNVSGITSSENHIGGVCGNNSSNNVITNCYYLKGTASRGIYNGSGEATVKTEADMKTQDFTSLLNENGGKFVFYGGYPAQKWEKDPSKYSTTLTYTVASDYIVTIPGEVTLDSEFTVSAEKVVLEQGKQLQIALTATSDPDNAFKVTNGGKGELTYEITNGENPVEIGNTVLTVNPATSASGETKLNFSKPKETPQFAGTYTGTVTFTVSVKRAKINVTLAPEQTSAETITLTAEQGMTWREWLASEYNTDNWVYNSSPYDSIFTDINFDENTKGLCIATEFVKGEWNVSAEPDKDDVITPGTIYVLMGL